MEEGMQEKNEGVTKSLIKLMVELEVRDRDGKLIEQRSLESHSFVKGLLGLLRGIHRAAAGGSVTDEVIRDIANTDQTYWTTDSSGNAFGSRHALNAPAGSGDYGLVVGTSTTPVTISDYALGGKIAHGTGSGQLSHGAHTVDPVTIDGSSASFKVIRTFTNLSGAAITVNEIGLYMYMLTIGMPGVAKYTCIARDIISGGISVPNGSTLTVRYIPTISTT